MSISLIAVFIPILLMGGIVGRLFREFAMTLSVAIMVSLAVSLATTPMMCALLLRRTQHDRQSRFHRTTERFFDAMLRGYERTLSWALSHPRLILAILLATVVTNFYLYTIVPKGFFPQQDTGRITGGIQADQSISFQLMRQKLQQFVSIIQKDPAVDTVVGFTGGGQTNGGFVFMSLKPLSERRKSSPSCRKYRSSPTSTATSRIKGSRPTSRSTAKPRRASESRSARSTTRSMTRSASAKCRPSTMTATSIT
jgi:multidrug efflux pump